MSVKSLEELEGFWNDFQPEYNRRLSHTMGLFNHSLVHMIHPGTASSVLELGCGPGNGTLTLLRRLEDEGNSSCSVTSCDLSGAMIECARGKVGSKVTFCQTDIQELPFSDNSFDRVMAGMSFNLVPDPEKALSEAFRVTKTGGRAGFSVWGRPHCSFALTCFNHACELLKFPVPDVRSNFHLGEMDQFKRMIRKAGFTNLLAWYTPAVYTEITPEDYAATLYAAPNRREYIKGLSPEDRELLHNKLLQLIRGKLEDSECPLQLEGLIVVACK